MSMTKISYIEGAESLFTKYEEGLKIDMDKLSLIFYKLNNGDFKVLQQYPLLTANKAVMLELTNMFGFAILDYIDPLCWQDLKFITAILENYTDLEKKSYKIRNKVHQEYKLDNIIAKINVKLINKSNLGQIMKIPHKGAISKLVRRLHKDNYTMYQYWLSRRYGYTIYTQDHDYVETDKSNILAQIKQAKFTILNSIDIKLWQDKEFINELITDLEATVKTNFCIPQIYLEKITGMIITHESIDAETAKRLIVMQPKLLALMINSPVISKGLIVLALQRDHILVETLEINMKPFDESELLQLVSANGLLIQYLSQEYQQNDQFVYAAINQNPLALEFVDARYRDDDKLVLECIMRNTAYYEFISPRLKQSINIAEETVKSNSYAVYLLEDTVREQLNIINDVVIGNNINHVINVTPNITINTH